MSRDSDQLLYVISAKKEMSWASFKEAWDYLYRLQTPSGDLEQEESNYKNKLLRVRRALDSLGHCDFDFSDDGSKVYAAPPVLVRLPCAGFPQAILAGARSPQTVQQLSDACQSVGGHVNLEVAEQPDKLVLVPKRVAVQAEEVRELEEIAKSLGIPFIETPSAWLLLNFSGSLDDYLATLKGSANSDLPWKRQTFDPRSLQFRQNQQTDIGIRLSQYSHPVRNTPLYYLWQDGQCAQIDRNWGRYAVLRAARVNVLVCDERRFLMAVPAGARLPHLLERALTLCSGYVATYTENLPAYSPEIRGWNLFRDIPPQIAEMTAAKLGQSLSRNFLTF
ncbi:MAG: hypothetical protein KME26_27425 [Oscillatoria princeps RMCB-10]|nr:hypothetical protein [Oscillatoria princeps RMCB-10]